MVRSPIALVDRFSCLSPSDDIRFQFTDNVTYILGNHTMKFGVDINYVKVSQTFIGFARGRYIFAGATIQDAIRGF